MAHEHLLVVDDERHMLDSMDFLLTAQGYHVGLAHDGREGLAYVREAQSTEQPVDLVITDIQMPVMDGVAMLKHLQKEQHSIPVLVLTAYGDRSLLIELIRQGCADYLDKPVGEEQLLDHIGRMLERNRAAERRLAHVLRNAEIGEQAAGIAHDFRNLLTMAQGFANLAMTNGCRSAVSRRYLSKIQLSCRRAARLTERLMAYGSAQNSTTPTLLDCNRIIAEAMELFETVVGRRIQLSFNPLKGLWRIESMRVDIEQIIMNLLINAKNAIQVEGEITIETSNEHSCGDGQVLIGTYRPGNAYVRITVHDDGCGIALNLLPNIFNAGRSGGDGTGIGLTITKRIVEQHKGFIQVESLPDHGSTFRIYLPAFNAKKYQNP
ncbi:MAG: response regulator [Chitinivibrionales bacterium]|nr:response regulator [Chitinivibrionales bacterium]MBD3356838.1 response regulator [Chitinivibrionales bacterium]